MTIFADMYTIQLENLTIGYRLRHKVITVAGGLTAGIAAGELTCLLGENGVGKSTLLRTVAGFQPLLGGRILIEEHNMQTLSQHDMARRVSVVLTDRPDVQNLTVAEVVGLGRNPYTGFWGALSADDKAIVDESLDAVGVSSLTRRRILTLSDGERQKVMIAKALAQQTAVILLDEPTAFLDFPSKVDMMQLLRRLAHDTQRTIFLSTHDLQLALQLADRLWLLDNAKNLHTGTPAELSAEGILARFVERGGISIDPRSLTIQVQR
jgi:iron complex transport system ATP-binding protein